MMASTISNLLFLLVRGYPDKREIQRLGLPAYVSSGFNVSVFDVRACMLGDRAEASASEDDDGFQFVTIKDIRDFELRIRQYAGDVLVFMNVSLSYRSRRIFRSLTTLGAPYVIMNAGTLPWPVKTPKAQSQSTGMWRFVSKSRDYKKVCTPRWWLDRIEPRVLDIFIRRFGYIAPPFWIAVSSKKRLHQTRRLFPQDRDFEKRIVFLGNMDYDTYLQGTQPNAASEERFAVFLDEYFPLHPDLDKHYAAIFSPEYYYEGMRQFFDRFEARHNIKVKIAAHPTAKYEARDERFGGREILQGETLTLTRDAALVLAHCSTSINFAVLHGKPIVLLLMDEMAGAVWGELMDGFANELKLPIVNVKSSYDGPESAWPAVDQDAYHQYIDAYIKPHEAPEKRSTEIMIERIRNLTEATTV